MAICKGSVKVFHQFFFHAFVCVSHENFTYTIVIKEKRASIEVVEFSRILNAIMPLQYDVCICIECI